MKTDTSDIFSIADSPDKVVCPPNQVFKNKDFIFLLTDGGHIVDDAIQYYMFMMMLKEIGEKEFTIRENIGATLTHRSEPFETTFSVDNTLDDFDKKIKEFDEHFGLTTLHWFVHGQKGNWGIYLAEWPTVNIIGCTTDLIDKFKAVFKIVGNGYSQVKELLDQEFRVTKDSEMEKEFIENYKIKNAPQQGV